MQVLWACAPLEYNFYQLDNVSGTHPLPLHLSHDPENLTSWHFFSSPLAV